MRSRSDSLTAAGTLAFGLYAGGGALGMPGIPGFMSRKDKINLSTSPQKQLFSRERRCKSGKEVLSTSTRGTSSALR